MEGKMKKSGMGRLTTTHLSLIFGCFQMPTISREFDLQL